MRNLYNSLALGVAAIALGSTGAMAAGEPYDPTTAIGGLVDSANSTFTTVAGIAVAVTSFSVLLYFVSKIRKGK